MKISIVVSVKRGELARCTNNSNALTLRVSSGGGLMSIGGACSDCEGGGVKSPDDGFALRDGLAAKCGFLGDRDMDTTLLLWLVDPEALRR